MDFSLTDEQRLLKDSIERLLADRCDFRARQRFMTEPAGWSRTLWQSYAELGLLGLFGLFICGRGLVRSHSMSREVHLSWDAPNSVHRISGYRVYRGTDGSTYQLLNSTAVTETKFVDLTVQAGQSYDYFVRSVDPAGTESLASNRIRITVPWLPDLVGSIKKREEKTR